jgi:2-oxoglutarate dehydrogenase complex dehydrogenase (E1) component-like enzyme
VDVAWVQEEPANMGAWPTIALGLPEAIGRQLRRVSRPASASPATGSHKIHETEQAELVQRALSG